MTVMSVGCTSAGEEIPYPNPPAIGTSLPAQELAGSQGVPAAGTGEFASEGTEATGWTEEASQSVPADTLTTTDAQQADTTTVTTSSQSSTEQTEGTLPPSSSPHVEPGPAQRTDGLDPAVVSRLPRRLRSVLDAVSISWGCHPIGGCHYGIWDVYNNSVWLATWLQNDPGMLYDVLTHELAHAMDSYVYDEHQRAELYQAVAGYGAPDYELVADCVTIAAGGSWTGYWSCDDSYAQELVRTAIS